MSRGERWRRRGPLLPALIFTIFITQIPFLLTIAISTLNWNVLQPGEKNFLGMGNYTSFAWLDNRFRSGTKTLHPVQQVRDGLPARGDSREGLRHRAFWPAPRRSSTWLQVPRSQGRVHRSRWRRRTAPAATLCVQVCPAKDKTNPAHKALNMAPQAPLREPERENYGFFLDLPEVDRTAGAATT